MITREEVEAKYKLLRLDGYRKIVDYLIRLHKEIEVLQDLVRRLSEENERLKRDD